ncbi:zinc-dependent peptidase [Marinobacter sp. M-5]|uniref:M90 family metallopeptidase n=1 Tax=Marinobacter sp. M-5 TaxID=3081089 RepID=UPI00293C765D|nr:zinc-dependent peptidase [Marinobacter sp. M-5]MDV3504960.1 zinc-dependent peptidase [Marinobacter sp. M-5]
MSSVVIFAIFALTVIGLSVFRLFFYRRWRRDRELRKAFPDHWRTLLGANVPFYLQLPEPARRHLEQRVQLFLAEKTFYGCDGFTVDDRVRVTIAGHACLLILARAYSDFDEVRSILVYPGSYRVEHEEDDGTVVSVREEIRAGEASGYGQVVLAWEECLEGAVHPEGDHNVILHEFAHQLDYLDGSADGAPPLRGEQARYWQRTMSQAYENLRTSLAHHHSSWLDPYGATEPAEFFAVLTEAFYQQPQHLKSEQPEVYAALCGFYRLDPLRPDLPETSGTP